VLEGMVVILRTQGGFSSRLRAIVSGILWAEDLDRKIVIYWPVEPANMPYSLGEILDIESIPRLCCTHAGYISKAHDVQSVEDMYSTIQVLGSESKEIRIKSYSSFHPEVRCRRGEAILRQLQILPKVLKLARETWTGMGGKSSLVGVHFPKIDVFNRIVSEFDKHMTLSEIIRRMRSEKETTRFCFVSDDSEAIVQIQKEFPGRVIIPKNHLDSTDIINWILLQKCCRILSA
jgi:hypothetical protein